MDYVSIFIALIPVVLIVIFIISLKYLLKILFFIRTIDSNQKSIYDIVRNINMCKYVHQLIISKAIKMPNEEGEFNITCSSILISNMSKLNPLFFFFISLIRKRSNSTLFKWVHIYNISFGFIISGFSTFFLSQYINFNYFINGIISGMISFIFTFFISFSIMQRLEHKIELFASKYINQCSVNQLIKYKQHRKSFDLTNFPSNNNYQISFQDSNELQNSHFQRNYSDIKYQESDIYPINIILPNFNSELLSHKLFEGRFENLGGKINNIIFISITVAIIFVNFYISTEFIVSKYSMKVLYSFLISINIDTIGLKLVASISYFIWSTIQSKHLLVEANQYLDKGFNIDYEELSNNEMAKLLLLDSPDKRIQGAWHCTNGLSIHIPKGFSNEMQNRVQNNSFLNKSPLISEQARQSDSKYDFINNQKEPHDIINIKKSRIKLCNDNNDFNKDANDHINLKNFAKLETPSEFANNFKNGKNYEKGNHNYQQSSEVLYQDNNPFNHKCNLNNNNNSENPDHYLITSFDPNETFEKPIKMDELEGYGMFNTIGEPNCGGRVRNEKYKNFCSLRSSIANKGNLKIANLNEELYENLKYLNKSNKLTGLRSSSEANYYSDYKEKNEFLLNTISHDYPQINSQQAVLPQNNLSSLNFSNFGNLNNKFNIYKKQSQNIYKQRTNSESRKEDCYNNLNNIYSTRKSYQIDQICNNQENNIAQPLSNVRKILVEMNHSFGNRNKNQSLLGMTNSSKNESNEGLNLYGTNQIPQNSISIKNSNIILTNESRKQEKLLRCLIDLSSKSNNMEAYEKLRIYLSLLHTSGIPLTKNDLCEIHNIEVELFPYLKQENIEESSEYKENSRQMNLSFCKSYMQKFFKKNPGLNSFQNAQSNQEKVRSSLQGIQKKIKNSITNNDCFNDSTYSTKNKIGSPIPETFEDKVRNNRKERTKSSFAMN